MFIIKEYSVMYLLLLKKVFVFCTSAQVIALKAIEIIKKFFK